MLLLACSIPTAALGGDWNGIRWDIEGTSLTVSGGDIPDLTASSSAPWSKFGKSVTSIAIGDGVSRIGERAFEDMTAAVTVDFGEVSVIGRMAFSGCSSLTEASLPRTVTEIGDYAFAECSALAHAVIPEQLYSMGEGVFESCSALASFSGGSSRYSSNGVMLTDNSRYAVYRFAPASLVSTYTVPEGITALHSGAFRDCTALTSVYLPTVSKIGDGAFYGCISLAEVSIPSVKTVGRASFYGCALRNIAFPASLERLGDEAFAFCTSLVIADFAGNAPAASEGIFYGCDPAFSVVVAGSSEGFLDGDWLGYPLLRHGGMGGELDGIRWGFDSVSGEFTLEAKSGTVLRDFESAADTPWYKYRKLIRELRIDGITAIGDNAFRYSAIEELDLPESVTRIGEWTFSGCTDLTWIKTDADVGGKAFFACVNLESAELGSSIIGTQAFSGCDSLKYVFTGSVAPTLGEYAFDGTNAVILYPYGGTGYDYTDIYSEAYTPGDADGNGACNISDVSLLLKYVAKWDVTLQKISADVVPDGIINLSDVTATLKYIAKWNISNFGPGRPGSRISGWEAPTGKYRHYFTS